MSDEEEAKVEDGRVEIALGRRRALAGYGTQAFDFADGFSLRPDEAQELARMMTDAARLLEQEGAQQDADGAGDDM